MKKQHWNNFSGTGDLWLQYSSSRTFLKLMRTPRIWITCVSKSSLLGMSGRGIICIYIYIYKYINKYTYIYIYELSLFGKPKSSMYKYIYIYICKFCKRFYMGRWFPCNVLSTVFHKECMAERKFIGKCLYLIWSYFFWIRMNGYKDNSFPTFFNMGMSLICRPESSNDCVVCTPIWKISYGRWFPWDVLSTMFPKECMAKGSSQGSAYISCGLILLTRDERI